MAARRPGGASPAENASGGPSPSGEKVKPGNSAREVAGGARTTSGAVPYKDGGAPTLRTTSGHALRSAGSNTATGTARPTSSGRGPATVHADSPMA